MELQVFRLDIFKELPCLANGAIVYILNLDNSDIPQHLSGLRELLPVLSQCYILL